MCVEGKGVGEYGAASMCGGEGCRGVWSCEHVCSERRRECTGVDGVWGMFPGSLYKLYIKNNVYAFLRHFLLLFFL